MKPDARLFRTNLTYLYEEALVTIAIIAGVVGYVWLWTDIWPVTGYFAPMSSWVGGALLVSGAFVAHRLRRSQLHLASHILILCILGGVACALLTFRGVAFAYLFILPILFASVLLSQRSVFLMAGVAGLLILVINREVPALSPEALLPISTIGVITVASWLTARNLHVTLAWFGEAYENAYRSEQLAREKEGELRKAFRSLDEMTHRLERTNHTLTLERNQAQEARRLKQEFAQTISHELRTPLNLIVAFTELMAQSPEYYGVPLPPPYMRDLSITHRNARHLQALVNDVLDLARLDSAQMTITPEETDPGALLSEAVNTARSLVELRGLRMVVELEDALPKLWLDAVRIRQVLFNLLNNAARFTPHGTVTARVRCADAEVIFSVADTGIGIAVSDIPRLFREFEQLDGGTRRRHDGAGLGLVISRRFVELHGGRIWVESEPGAGSVFSFALPVSRRSLSCGLPGISADDVPELPGSEPTLLVMTASPSAATLLTRHIRGRRVVIAPTLDHARLLAQRLTPQCVLLDTACDRLTPNGLQEIAHTWGLPETSFMAIPLPGEELLRHELSVEGYVTKPVSIQDIRQILRRYAPGCVLVIDDDQDFVRMLRRVLETTDQAYRVMCAFSGQEGLALMQHTPADIILVDLELPDIRGVDLIQRFRANAAWSNVPIIVISAQDQLDDAESIRQPLILARPNGLTTSDVVRLVQQVTG